MLNAWSCASSANSSAPLISVKPLAAVGWPVSGEIVTSDFGSGVSALFVPSKTAPDASSCRISTSLPLASWAGAISNWRPFSGGWSELILIALIASDFVITCPVE